MSPRPFSSSPKTSFSFCSAGTSAWKRSTAVRMTSAVDAIGLDLVPLQKLLADHHALDLRGPLADQQQRRVAVEALDLVLLRVAIAAVDAEALLDALLAGLRGEQLRHPRLQVGALAGVLHPRRLAGEQAGQLERPLADADAAGGDVDPADLERVHHLHEALADAGLLAAGADPRRRGG